MSAHNTPLICLSLAILSSCSLLITSDSLESPPEERLPVLFTDLGHEDIELQAGLSDVTSSELDAELLDIEPPDAALPDIGLPDAELPDMEPLDAELPDMEPPDAALPDMEPPEPEAGDMLPPLSSNIIGHIDSIEYRDDFNDWRMTGWACQVGDLNSLKIDIYAGGNRVTGTWLSRESTTVPQEAEVENACAAPGGGPFRFNVSFSNEHRATYSGQAIFVYGVHLSTLQVGLLTKSGLYSLP